jgi:uncharacterized protein (TIGR02118 family)
VVKLIVVIVRRADISPEQFHQHWRVNHAQLVRNNPACQRYMRKYIQCHTLSSEYAAGKPPFDGVTELWFDSAEDKDKFFSDPDYLREVKPDEPRFADMTRTVSFLCNEEPVIG